MRARAETDSRGLLVSRRDLISRCATVVSALWTLQLLLDRLDGMHTRILQG